MVKGSIVRKLENGVDRIFVDRWSPRAMSGGEISEAELRTLFEAARWAPSSYNNQSWRILWARRGTKHWDAFFGLLVEQNKVWAKNAGALLVFVSKTTFDHNGKPSITHSYDTGAAWENLALQGSMRGLVVHGMQGFDYDRARTELRVPADFKVEAMAAVGRPGDKEKLPAELKAKDEPNGRKPLAEIALEGGFGSKP